MIDQNKLEAHLTEWSNCERCPLGRIAFKHCPLDITPSGGVAEITDCDVLFIGEGPGRAEDTLGVPFCGPSGKLLRATVADCGGAALSVAYSNLVACRPQDMAGGHDRAPRLYEIHECHRRVFDLINILQPRAVVAVGRLASLNLPSGFGSPLYSIAHPSYVLRSGGVSSSFYTAWKERVQMILDRLK